MKNNNILFSIDKAIKAIKICIFDFPEKSISLYKSFSFFSILIFLTLFISISLEADSLISLDRSVWIDGKFQGEDYGKKLAFRLKAYLILSPFLNISTFFAKCISQKYS